MPRTSEQPSRGTPPGEGGAGGSESGRRHRGRNALLVLGAVLAAPFLLLVVLVLLLQLDPVSTRGVDAALQRFNPWPGTNASVDEASLSGLDRLSLRGLRFTTEDGRNLLRIETLSGRIRPLPLTRGRLEIPRLDVSGVEVRMHQRPDSSWIFLAPFVGPDTSTAAADTTGAGMRIRMGDLAIRNVDVRARFLAESDSILRIENLFLRLDTLATPDPVVAVVDSVRARIFPPSRPDRPARLAGSFSYRDGIFRSEGVELVSDTSEVRARGTFAVSPGRAGGAEDIDFELHADPLAFRDVGALLPGFDSSGGIRLDARLTGSTRLLEVDVEGESFGGGFIRLSGRLTPGTRDSVVYDLEGTLRGVSPREWGFDSTAVAGVDATFDADLRGTSLDSLNGSLSVEASAARLAGRGLRPTTLSATFDGGRASFQSSGGMEAWFRWDARGTVRPFDSLPPYRVEATVRQLEPLSGAGTRLASGVARLDASGRGIAPPGAEGSADVRLDGVIGTAAVETASLAVRWDSASARLDLSLPLEEGDVEARGRVDWGGSDTRIALPRFDVRRLDLSEVLTDTVSGFVTARGSADAVLGDSTITSLELDATVEQAAWRDLTLDSGVVSVRIDRGRARADARLLADAGRVRLVASGDPSGPSPTWNLEELEVTGLDLSELPGELPTSRIDGVARMSGRGTSPETITATGSLTLDASSIAGISVDTTALSLELDRGSFVMDGSLGLLGGDVSLRAAGRPLDSVPTFRISSATFRDLRFDSTLAGPMPATLSGTLRAEVALPPDTVPRVDARLALDGGRIRDVALEGGLLTLRSQGPRWILDAGLAVDGGTAGVETVATLTRDSAGLGVESLQAVGDLDLPGLARIVGRDTLDGGLRASFRASGGGRGLEEASWRVGLSAAGALGRLRLDSLALDGALSDGVFRLDTLSLASNVVDGRGGGFVSLREPPADGPAPPEELTLALTADSVGILGDLLGIDPLTLRSGMVSLRASRAGPPPSLEEEVPGTEAGILPADALHLEGSLSLGGLIVDRYAADTARASFVASVEEGGLGEVRTRLAAEEVAVPAVVLESIEAGVAHDSASTRFAVTATRDEEHALRVLGAARLPDSSARLDSLRVDLPDADWRLAETTILSWGDRIDPGGLELRSGERRLSVTGYLDRNGTQDLAVVMDSVPLAGLADVAGMERVEGVMSGRLEVTGPAEAPELGGDLDGTINGAGVDLAISPVEGGLRLDGTLLDPDEDSLVLGGTVPFTFSMAASPGASPPAEAPFGLEVSATAFSLGWLRPFLQPLGVGDLGGSLSGRATVRGSTGSPDLSGTLTLADGLLEIPGQGIGYEGIEGTLELAGPRIEIPTLTAEADGSATVSGSVLLEPLTEPTLDLEAVFRGFHAVENAFTSLHLDGDASISGDLLSPRVEGSLVALNSDIYTDPIGEGPSVDPVQLTEEDYRMLESYFGYEAPRAAADPPTSALEGWSIDVAVEVGSDVWLRRRAEPEVRVQLGGSVDVRKSPGDSLQVFGTLEAIPARSYFEQFGRRFEVVRGEISFNGPLGTMEIDGSARYDVPSFRDPAAPEVSVTADITGSLDSLSLSLGSNPSMENADILSYLATGRPAESAAAFGGSGGGGALDFGEGLAMERAAELLEQAAEDAVGLDVIEIRYGSPEGAILIAGRYVNPRLFVGFQQPLTLGRRVDDPIGPQTRQTEVEIEYTWYQWLLVQLEGGQSEVSVFLRTKRAF